MRVDSLAVELRPRPMSEAVDLGVRLVQANAGSVWRTCTPVFVSVFLLALLGNLIAPWVPMLLVFWLKPWLDRSVLFVLSRAVFGQSTRFADLWQARRAVWWQGLARALLLSRWSPWRSFTQAIEQLELQTGSARRSRRQQLLAGQRPSAFATQWVFAWIETLLMMSLLLLLVYFTHNDDIIEAFTDLWRKDGSSWLQFGAYAVVVCGLEPLFVGAGFAMYLNRRVQLESWDIEQEFRRAFA